MELYDFQQRWVDYALKHHYCINGDEMGLGKTIQALALANLFAKRVLIVCPAYLRKNWENEVRKFFPNPNFTFKTASYSSIKKNEKDFEVADIVIADEAHYLKNPKAIRTQTFHEYTKKYLPTRLVLLSGTPIQNRVSEFYSLILLCSYNPSNTSGVDIRDKFRSEYSFNRHFCKMSQIRIKGRIITKFYGAQNLPSLKGFLKGKYTRRLSKDVLDLPELRRKSVLVDYAGDGELEEAWEKHNDGVKGEHIMRAKAQSAMYKANFTVKYVKDIIEQGEQVVIFTDHLSSLPVLLEGLKTITNVAMVSGKVATDRRAELVADFQKGKYGVFVATIGSASVGFTLTGAKHLVFNDLSWVPANNAQAEKRIHRIGQESECMIHYIYGSTIDETIGKSLFEKQKVLNKILGGT